MMSPCPPPPPWKPKGPSTYLNSLQRHELQRLVDQTPEDAFDLPPFGLKVDPLSDPNSYKGAYPPGTVAPAAPRVIDTSEVTHEYSAAYTATGGVSLVLTTVSNYRTERTIAAFDTFADAQTAAEALNNLKGY